MNEELQTTLEQLLDEHGMAFWDGLAKIVSQSYFGLCTCGRLMPVRNIRAAHFATCSHCRTYWQVGENLFSGWRYESESDWARTQAFIKRAREIEPLHPVIEPYGHLEIVRDPTSVGERAHCEQVGKEKNEVAAETANGNPQS